MIPALALVALLQAVDAPGVQVDPRTNVPIERGAVLDPTLPEIDPIPGMDLELSVGGVGAFTQEDGAIKPFARIRTVTPLPFFSGGKRPDGTKRIASKWNPRLGVTLDLTGLPGATVNPLDLATFTSVELKVGLSQPLFQNRYQRFGILGQAGFATRMNTGGTEALNKTAKWAGGGFALEQKQNKAWLTVILDGDQRLVDDGSYAFGLAIAGQVRLWTEKDPNSSIHNVGFSLGGDAGLCLWDYAGRGYDVVRVWVTVSR